MATNKNALIRYRTIDKCLQNRNRKWTLQDLIDACSDALYEYEGKDSYVSKRTIQLDIQHMRSDRLGYNAPIIVYKRKFYTYEDEYYSITDIPLDQLDMDILTESVEMLAQFKDFSLFNELDGVIQKLEDKIYRASQDRDPIIHLEKNENLKGLKHLDTLYQAILKKIVLKLEYKSFKSQNENEIRLHGYILKEYNNRWFIVGRKHNTEQILTLALDRIVDINLDLKTTYHKKNFKADQYYKNTYGVTVMDERSVKNILLWIDAHNAPYVRTKPFHSSQLITEEHDDGSMTIKIHVHHNYEIERLILGFGDAIEVLRPKRLRRRIHAKLKLAAERYLDSTS